MWWEIWINAFGEFSMTGALGMLATVWAAYWVGFLVFAGALSLYLIKKW